jgi:hypothetical protein
MLWTIVIIATVVGLWYWYEGGWDRGLFKDERTGLGRGQIVRGMQQIAPCAFVYVQRAPRGACRWGRFGHGFPHCYK